MWHFCFYKHILYGAAVTFGLESANIVGYQEKAVGASGFTLITPTFKNVDGTTLTLANLSGSFEFFDSIQTLDGIGETLDEYFYLGDGWYDGEQNPCNDVPLTEGGSILFNSQGTTAVTFSGTVNPEPVSITCATTGFTAIGNASPKDLKLSEIVFEGIDFFDSIQVLDEIGETKEEYFYLGDGWYDSEQNPCDIPIKAGEGILFNAASGSQVTVKIPSAL